MPRAAVGKIVAVDGCDYHVAQFPTGGRAGDVLRFGGIESEFVFDGRTLRHRTESAAARAEIAEDHEGRGAAMKAFVEIRAARRFANGMKIQTANLSFERMHGLMMRCTLAKPLGQAGLRRRSSAELNQLSWAGIELQLNIFA